MGAPHASEAKLPKGYPQGIRTVTMRGGVVLNTTSAWRRRCSRVAASDEEMLLPARHEKLSFKSVEL